jgi:lysyl oxidase
MPFHRGLAAALAAALLALGVAAAGITRPPRASADTGPASPCIDPLQDLRCPDLVVTAPYDLTIDRYTRPGHVLLRATSSLNNRGAGPLELHGHRSGSRSMKVTQVIYRRNGTRAFIKTAGLLGYKFVSGRRLGFTFPNESYWKFRDAARFQLWSLDDKDRAVKLVRFGPKLFYCFRDLQRTRPSARSPRRAVYPACSQNPRQRRVTLGTSVGWSDIYPYTYPEQWIDVTGLRGRFAYAVVADPFNRILESNEQNNLSETFVSLPSGRVLGTITGVSKP